MSSPPDGVCDVNKGVDAAVVHGFPPENSSPYKQAMQCYFKIGQYFSFGPHPSKHTKATSMFFSRPEHAGFREVPQGAASVVLQVHRVNVLCGSRLMIRDNKQRQIINKGQKKQRKCFLEIFNPPV